MSAIPPAHEVRALIERGLELAPRDDLKERARLLAARSGWPFTYPDDLGSVPLDEYRDAGLEAAEIAFRLGDADLASGALDQATAADSFRGNYAPIVPIWERRWALRDRLTDDLEIGDLYAMGGWVYWEVGEYERSADIAGQITHSQEMALAVHARAWKAAAQFRLGSWDDALTTFHELRQHLDDRRDSPPYFAAHAYAIAALIHRLRGQRLESDRIAAVVHALDKGSVRAFGWRAWVSLAEGDFARAATVLAAPPTSWEIHASVAWEARCDSAMVGSEPTELAATIASDARSYAARAGTRSVTPFADRLAGVTAFVAGDHERSAELLGSAVEQFDDLAVRWEAARSRMLLGRALRATGRADRLGQAQDAEHLGADATKALGVVDDAVLRATLARMDAAGGVDP